jgi:hypothetical protein
MALFGFCGLWRQLRANFSPDLKNRAKVGLWPETQAAARDGRQARRQANDRD